MNTRVLTNLSFSLQNRKELIHEYHEKSWHS